MCMYQGKRTTIAQCTLKQKKEKLITTKRQDKDFIPHPRYETNKLCKNGTRIFVI